MGKENGSRGAKETVPKKVKKENTMVVFTVEHLPELEVIGIQQKPVSLLAEAGAKAAEGEGSVFTAITVYNTIMEEAKDIAGRKL